MVPLISKTSVVVVLALASAVAQSAPEVKSVNQETRRKNDAASSRQYTKSGAREEEMAAPDPTPIPAMAPEELPARPPRVAYRNGQLFVDSDNSTLAEVLNAICKEMGAQIEKPPNADTERVAAHVSGPPRRVIERLLDDGKFGYIILSSLQDPTGVQKVILTGQTRSDSPIGSTATAQAANRRTMVTPQVEPSPPPATSAEVTPSSQPQPPLAQAPTVGGETLAGDQARPIPVSSSEAQGPGDAMQSAQNQDSSQPQQAKTPMQVLQDLYRRRQELQPQNLPPQKPQD